MGLRGGCVVSILHLRSGLSRNYPVKSLNVTLLSVR